MKYFINNNLFTNDFLYNLVRKFLDSMASVSILNKAKVGRILYYLFVA